MTPLGHKEFCKPLIGIAGRRCLDSNVCAASSGVRMLLCLENADERGGSLRICCLLLPLATSPDQARDPTRSTTRYTTAPRVFPNITNTPCDPQLGCVGSGNQTTQAGLKRPVLNTWCSGRCQEFVWKNSKEKGGFRTFGEAEYGGVANTAV